MNLGDKLWRWEGTNEWPGIQRVHIAAYENAVVVNPPSGLGEFRFVKSNAPVEGAKMYKSAFESVRNELENKEIRADGVGVRKVIE